MRLLTVPFSVVAMGLFWTASAVRAAPTDPSDQLRITDQDGTTLLQNTTTIPSPPASGTATEADEGTPLQFEVAFPAATAAPAAPPGSGPPPGGLGIKDRKLVLTEPNCTETTGETCKVGDPSDVITTHYSTLLGTLTVTLNSDPVSLNSNNASYTIPETGNLDDVTRFFFPDYYIRSQAGFPTETFIDDAITPPIRIFAGSDLGGTFTVAEPGTVSTIVIGLLALVVGRSAGSRRAKTGASA